MIKKVLTLSGLALACFASVQAQITYNYTGALQTYTVPACVDSVYFEVYGAQGGNDTTGSTGGLGGYVYGRLAVMPGDVLNIYVGGQNGYNGGGTGGQDGNTVFSGPPAGMAPSGGGASDVRLNGLTFADRIIVAGGGGGAGDNGDWPGCQVAGPAGNGGAGGSLIGGSGTFGVGTPCNCGGGGGDGGAGGTQAAGGIAGGYYGNTACLRAGWTAGTDGSLGQGGSGSTVYYNGTGAGGGGGGGYYGGGAGGNGSDTTPGGGGGGGSSYTAPSIASVMMTAGTRSGDGMVVLYTVNSGTAANASAASTSVCVDDGNVALTGTPVGGTWSGTGVVGNNFSPSTAGAGTWMLYYTYTSTCTSTDSVAITVSLCTGIDHFSNGLAYQVYPNPNNGTFEVINATNANEMIITITDLTGRVVYSSVNDDVIAGSTHPLTLENVANGVYMMNVTMDGRKSAQKITVQK